MNAGRTRDTSAPTQTLQALLAASEAAEGRRLARRLRACMAVETIACEEALAIAKEASPGHAVVFAPLRDACHVLGPAGPPRRTGVTRREPRRPLVVFLTDDAPPNQYFPTISSHGIRCFLHEDFLDCRQTLDMALRAAFDPHRAGGLATFFGGCDAAGATAIHSQVIDSHHRRHAAIEAIHQEVGERFFPDCRAAEVRLALEEVVNNAIFHAFREDGRPRYTLHDADRLRGEDRVTIEYLTSESCFAFSVTDNAGALTGDAVRRHIQRQLSGAGQFDLRGRGIFLTFSFANGFILETIPGEMTRITVTFSRLHPPACKLFLIGTLPAPAAA